MIFSDSGDLSRQKPAVLIHISVGELGQTHPNPSLDREGEAPNDLRISKASTSLL
jgi:hypothetical protein